VTYLALGALALLLVQGIASATLLRHVLRAQDRERQAARLTEARLIDQVCHLADKPWTPPPLRSVPEGPPDEREPVFIDVDNEP